MDQYMSAYGEFVTDQNERPVLQHMVTNIYNSLFQNEKYDAVIVITNYGSLIYFVYDMQNNFIRYNKKIILRRIDLSRNDFDSINEFITKLILNRNRTKSESWFIEFFESIDLEITTLNEYHIVRDNFEQISI